MEPGRAVQDLVGAAGFATDLCSYGVRPEHVEAIVHETLRAERRVTAPRITTEYDRATASDALRAVL